MKMIRLLRPAFVFTVLFTLLLGLGYPLAMTGLAGALMPDQAGGSLIRRDGTVIGSALIGQPFGHAGYFWPRPSLTADTPYNAASSGGANYGATSAALRQGVATEIARLRAAGVAGPVPADAAVASASGLDPDISPAFAEAQAGRVAAARGLDPAAVSDLVRRHTAGRLLGFIGEPRVNVLGLNLALDEMAR